MAHHLVTCPVCKVDQHVYKNRICTHSEGILQCSGSGRRPWEPRDKFVPEAEPQPLPPENLCEGRKTLRECAEMIENLKKTLLSEKYDCIPVGAFSEQAFLLAIASLDAATAHMRTAEYWEARND